jgi:hypothetical protein
VYCLKCFEVLCLVVRGFLNSWTRLWWVHLVSTFHFWRFNICKIPNHIASNGSAECSLLHFFVRSIFNGLRFSHDQWKYSIQIHRFILSFWIEIWQIGKIVRYSYLWCFDWTVFTNNNMILLYLYAQYKKYSFISNKLPFSRVILTKTQRSGLCRLTRTCLRPTRLRV